MNNTLPPDESGSIAVVGFTGRFPGAGNVEEYWRNLRSGVESITFFSDRELADSGVDARSLKDPRYIKAAGVLEEDPGLFDAAFFGLTPREAEITDPQHRIFLECAWEALESAGYDSETYQGSIGVYAGADINSYVINLHSHPELLQLVDGLQLAIGNEKDYVPTRVSYKLNLRGPSVSVNTACSTSLVAVHLACQSLLNGECDMALAGGVSIKVPHKRGYQAGGIFSPDGHCRAFDAGAQGTLGGSGVGIVVLKRLEDALSDRDTIHAVIKGSAINNDGAMKVGYTAPSMEGQAEVIAEALAMARIDPQTVTYVETHGTGTPLGDPIEIAALTKAFRVAPQVKGFCAIGSVKTNIGHLDTAAGVTGLIKTILALEHKLIPPSLHFEKANPAIDFSNSPFFVNTELSEWKGNGAPLRAGVSSFGIGGTNAHVVLEETPPLEPSTPSRAEQLLVLSAKTEAALEQATANLSDYLQSHLEANLADVAYTLQMGRRHFVCRRALVARDTQDAVANLTTGDSKRVITRRTKQLDTAVAFMFPGQGAQYVNMGAHLYDNEPIFRASVDECAETLVPHLGIDLRKVLYPGPSQTAEAEHRITETLIAQPALFVIEYALAQLWECWGIGPKAVIGHSLGEYVAACLAGVLSREAALFLVAERAKLMQQLPGGAMLAVRLPFKEVEPLLSGNLSVAAVNAPSVTVVAGSCDAVEVMERRLSDRRVGYRRLPTSHAFHSEMLDPIVKSFTEVVTKVKLNPPRLPWVSCLSGDWIAATQATDPNYWAQQLRQPVQFAAGVGKLFDNPERVLLEVGPGNALSRFVKQNPAKPAEQIVLSSLQQGGDGGVEIESMLHSLGYLWVAGVRVNWSQVHGDEKRHRLPLPTYPFERERYWIERRIAVNGRNQHMPATVEVREPPAILEPLNKFGGDPMATSSDSKASASELAQAAKSSREKDVLSRLRAIFADLSGLEAGGLDCSANFLELGFESLFLTQAASVIQKNFQVSVSFRQLLESLSTLESLAGYVSERMPQEQDGDRGAIFSSVDSPMDKPMAAAIHPNSTDVPETLERIITKQIELMSRQLDLLGNRHRSPDGVGFFAQGNDLFSESPAIVSSVQIGGAFTVEPDPTAVSPEKSPSRALGPYRALTQDSPRRLTPQQRKQLDALVARYTARTNGSKRYTRDHRAHLADPRSVAGFRSVWKELTYPVVVERSSGCKLWDIDGNEYVDLVSGFGSSLFGYTPAFVAQAVEAQLKRGIEIGPQSPLAGEVAQLICELTDMERAAFCNTGSEAVMAALRVARTITGRNKIALFSGSYHGMFDEVLVRPIGASGVSQPRPIAPGIVPDMVKNVLVLEYDNPASLEILRKNSNDLAAVLVEPVQSRRPDLQPKEFLRALRDLTADVGAALILDEMITGFRSHPGGVQRLFGVKADLAAYGKVVGGGLPIGILAGKAKFMDALDGGMWNYGDESSPEVGVTFFAGTFVRHPLALAAAKAVLTHLKQHGPSLQTQLNDRTAKFVDALNAYAKQAGAPIRVEYFSSLFCIDLPQDLPFASLVFTYMREKGVHALEGRPCFLTTAHTDADLDHVNRAFKESIQEMQEAGFLPGRRSAALAMTAGSTQDADKAPLSFALTEAQRELWLAAQIGDDASRAFIESVALRLRGPLNIAAMLAAIQELVLRHDSLRTTFSKNGEEQYVAEDLTLEVPLTNLADLKHKDREERLAEIAAEESRKSFDLSRGPLLRLHLIKLEERHHVLLVTTHHIVVDGWSIGVLLSELAIIYSAGCRGEAHGLPKPRQFAEYAQWQTDQRQSSARAASETYWLEQFKEPVPILELPTDRPRPRMKTYNGARQQIVLPRVLFHDLRRVAARQGSTLFATLFAGFNILLHRLTAQEDIVVGVPAAGQSSFDAQDLVGHCVNFLPLRARVKGSASFLEHLSSVKKLVLDAYDHQNYTYGSLLQKLKLHREASRLPLVSLSFNLDRARDKLNFDGMDVEISTQAKQAVNFDGGINVMEAGGDIEVEWHYNTDLFDAETIRRWLRLYQTVLESIVANPERGVSDLRLLTDPELRQLLIEWNDTKKEYPKYKCIHEVFADQVEKAPDAIAVIFENQQLTYRELNVRANQLAHYLIQQGVSPEVLVGICMERSLEMVVGIFAILKAGGAYVPLDPDYPKERLAFMLEDTRAPVLLTQRQLLSRLPEMSSDERLATNDGRERSPVVGPRSIICLDTDWDVIAKESDENPVNQGNSGNLAYVIYTSGSTGQPKGVEIQHAGLVSLAWWHQRAYGVTPADRATQLASPAFDASAWELWPYLTAGASIDIPNEEVIAVPSELLSWLAARRITICFLPTPLAEAVLDEPLPESLALRVMLTGGDKLHRTPMKPLPFRLSNNYGPTENTVVTTWSSVFTDRETKIPPPVGRPVANTRVYILHQHLQPVPIGVSGELHISGVGLARGYLNRPELTAEKFIPDPFSDQPGARLYKTGDLVKYLPDGNIEFLGRIDDQVKIRGFRIELGEIESLLSQHPGVKENVLAAREDQPGDKRLVAYVVPNQESTPTASELRSFLKSKLPDYMIPSAFVTLKDLPLTPNAKVDRKALPAADQSASALNEAFVAPRTSVEQTLAEICAQVLKLEKVGIHDDFFDLGGHSLLAIQVISRVRDAFHLEIPVRVLFERPTIEDLALTVEEALTDEIESQTQDQAHQIY